MYAVGGHNEAGNSAEPSIRPFCRAFNSQRRGGTLGQYNLYCDFVSLSGRLPRLFVLESDSPMKRNADSYLKVIRQ